MGNERRRPSKVELLLERLGARPSTLLVFALSAGLLAALHAGSFGRLQAPAVASAVALEHPAPTPSVVERLHVHPGDHVDPGAPLLTLSSRFLDRELALLDAELESVSREAHLEQLRLVEDERSAALKLLHEVGSARAETERARALEERQSALVAGIERQVEEVKRRAAERVAREDELRATTLLLEEGRAEASEATRVARSEIERLRLLEGHLRARPELPLLASPTADLYEAKLELLRRRRQAIVDDLSRLTVVAALGGRVGTVLRTGSSVAAGSSVASVLPDLAEEVVAYVPPDTDPALLTPGVQMILAGPALSPACARPALVLRHGAAVELAPGQLGNPLRSALWGLPVYGSLPAGCELGVGQTLQVELARATP